MPALPLSFSHSSINIPDAGGLSPLSEDEIVTLTRQVPAEAVQS